MGTLRPVILGIALIAMASACSRDAHVEGVGPCTELRGAAREAKTPVVLVVNDTMRRDRLGVYGGPAKTPTFDAFARANILFNDAFTQAPWTRPAMASLFTGLLPSQHGVGMEQGEERKAPRAVAPDITTLAELLRANGYRTAAFVSNPWMETKFGFDQGFDVYDTSFARWGLDNEEAKLPGVAVSAKALEWVASLPPGTPYFLFVHYLDSHRPYPSLHVQELAAHEDAIRKDERFLGEKERQELAALVRIEARPGAPAPPIQPKLSMLELAYDKGIEHFDFALARLLEGLDTTEEGRRAAVIVTSDHGEALYERGYGNHGRGLHDDELAIPMAMKLPGVVGPSDGVSCLTGLVDVLPTLCTYLGVACPTGIAGHDLLAPRATRRYLVSEAVGVAPRHRSIRNEHWKLIWQPDGAPEGARPNAYSLYEIAKDPSETHDLIDTVDPKLQAIARRLEAELAAAGPAQPVHDAPSVEIEKPVEERLRQLGYVE